MVFMGLFSGFAYRFFAGAKMEDILAGYSFMAILAIGQAFPIIAHGIDLSVGTNVGLGAMILFDLNVIFELPGWGAIPIAIAACALAGALNGLLVTLLRLQPFVATLATFAAYRGGVYAISGRQLYPALATQSIRDPSIRSLESYVDVGRWIGLARLAELPSIPW